jgi:hypothetical protein
MQKRKKELLDHQTQNEFSDPNFPNEMPTPMPERNLVSTISNEIAKRLRPEEIS